MSHHRRLVVLVVLAIVVTTIGVLVIWARQSSFGIPNSISHKANFSIIYPQAKVVGLNPERASLAYDDANKGLSYTVLVDGKKVVVTEQSTPDIFSQSGVYSYKVDQAHSYASFNSAAGEVTLTRPEGLQGLTVAWVNAKGTLTLGRAFQDLSETEWKLLFNNMEVIR